MIIIHLTNADGSRVPATLVSLDGRFLTAAVAGHYYRFRRSDGVAVWSGFDNPFHVEAAELARIEAT